MQSIGCKWLLSMCSWMEIEFIIYEMFRSEFIISHDRESLVKGSVNNRYKSQQEFVVTSTNPFSNDLLISRDSPEKSKIFASALSKLKKSMNIVQPLRATIANLCHSLRKGNR